MYSGKDIKLRANPFFHYPLKPPTKTFHLKGERCTRGKLSKARSTGLAAGNGVGEKLPMFIIGKKEKPRCFKGVKNLPFQYKSQNNSWMDSKVITDYVRRLDAKFNAEGRKVALIKDNCPAHPNVVSWDAVSTNTVINCFRKAGILKEIPVASINGEEDPFELLEENVKELRSRGLVEKDFAVEDYVNIDFDICSSKAIAITDQEILNSILNNDCAEVDEEIDEDSNDLPPVKSKLSEVARAIELIKCWSLFENNGVEIRQSLNLVKMFDKHSLEAKKQSKMDDFFEKL
ncbi:uncharacterized protein LOC136078571 [Hydra vulgaris]|uniref:Uncharacterized protein LOC136078571 n=1 Tax=Hydra vulgaris TaxID=6087 RepID=A0ABM4BMW7_HYDVU